MEVIKYHKFISVVIIELSVRCLNTGPEDRLNLLLLYRIPNVKWQSNKHMLISAARKETIGRARAYNLIICKVIMSICIMAR